RYPPIWLLASSCVPGRARGARIFDVHSERLVSTRNCHTNSSLDVATRSLGSSGALATSVRQACLRNPTRPGSDHSLMTSRLVILMPQTRRDAKGGEGVC